MLPPPYVYQIRVAARPGPARVVADVDLGFGWWLHQVRLRLAGPAAAWPAAQPGTRLVVRTAPSGTGWAAHPTEPGARPAYTYAAVLGVGHDGDNVTADIDLGLNCWLESQSVRLAGCNAREMGEPGGPEACTNMAVEAPAGTRVLLWSVKDDKYGGRYNARVQMPGGYDLAGRLIDTGWVAAWNGRGPKPVPAWPRVT